MLPSIGPLELVLVLALALIIFGPGKLPEAGKALGNTIKEFRRASRDIRDEALDNTNAQAVGQEASK